MAAGLEALPSIRRAGAKYAKAPLSTSKGASDSMQNRRSRNRGAIDGMPRRHRCELNSLISLAFSTMKQRRCYLRQGDDGSANRPSRTSEPAFGAPTRLSVNDFIIKAEQPTAGTAKQPVLTGEDMALAHTFQRMPRYENAAITLPWRYCILPSIEISYGGACVRLNSRYVK